MEPVDCLEKFIGSRKAGVYVTRWTDDPRAANDSPATPRASEAGGRIKTPFKALNAPKRPWFQRDSWFFSRSSSAGNRSKPCCKREAHYQFV